MEKLDPDFEDLIGRLGNLPRARPDRDLLPGIEARIARPEAVVVPLRQWRAMVAAAVLLLLLNAAAITFYTNESSGQDQTLALVSDYLLYE
ncbi:hypothetical protein GGR28_002248 [Lewinella aquimaris]|uniref:Uncharacterized protein n=1 Tax=Neolewinella aquimaris TaxID=1835722 RepID=A0A840E6P2_9BACT|nr:hypothetical protein [Neolewinella aquimaris]MBB4079623.1 hypothetical protein [Neolewinella aquimaris]